MFENTDEEIIRMLKRKDEKALKMLMERYGKDIVREIEKVNIKNYQDVEECIDDTLWCIWKCNEEKKIENLKNFILTIAKRRAVDMLRTKLARKRAYIIVEYMDEAAYDIRTPTPDEKYEMKEMIRCINEFYEGLKNSEKKIFYARIINGKSMVEISIELGKSQDAVKSYLRRLRKLLRKFLEKNGY